MRGLLIITTFLSLFGCGRQDAANGDLSKTAGLSNGASRTEWSLTPEQSAAGIPAGFGHQIDMQNRFNPRWLRYQEKDHGINLGWVVGPVGQWTFHRESGAAGPIRYEEPIAIHNQVGGFLRHKSREYGINLAWNASPKYEWVIKGSLVGTVGSAPVGLFNLTQNDFVVYCSREYGVELRWARDCPSR